MIDRAEIMTNATQLRRQLGEDGSSPIDIFALVGNIQNLSLVFYPMSNRLSGICVRCADNLCVIGINSEMSKGRQRFSLAHELYHLFFDTAMVSFCGKAIGSGKETEKKADLFASYFLMPNDELIRKVEGYVSKNGDKKLSLEDIIRIEQYFGVSHQATVIRLKESNCLSQADMDKYMQVSVKSRAEAMGLNGDLYKPNAIKYGTYGYYIEQTDRLMQAELISQGKYESLLLDAFRPDLVYGDNEGGDVID